MDIQLVYSLITAVFVGGVAGYVGSLMATKRMALVGDALGHVALPGVALAFLYNFDIALGAFLSLFVGVFLIWLLRVKSELYLEAITGIIFVVSLAVSFLMIPSQDIESALIGDIAKINYYGALAAIAVSIIVFLIIRRALPKMVLSTLYEDLAKSQGINVKKYDFIYLLAIGAIVALGIKLVGSLLIGALVIVPAAASRNWSNNLRQYSYGAMAIGILSCVAGVLVYKNTGFSAGPLIVLISALVFLISLIFRRK